MATKFLRSLILTACFLCTISVSAQNNESQPSKEMVIAQMNYCINSLTSIINNNSMYVLDHETDMLLNNLTMEHVSNLYVVVEYRKNLIEGLSNMKITEEERDLLKRINEMQREAMLWQSLSSGLNPTMLLMPGSAGPQMAFMALLSAARTVVEYKTAQNEQDIAELKAMWELRKQDLNSIKELRTSALELEFKLYNEYNLKEFDRLTEKTASEFQDICLESDAQKRLRRLESDKETYGHLLEYPYYVGMAYIDIGNFKQAKPFLLEYIRRYEKTPIFRYDEKSGCVALAFLAYESSLSTKETEDYIDMALKNLPNVGVAALQCILKYIQIGDSKAAYKLLCNSIDNPNLDNKDALVMLASQFINDIKNYSSLYKDIDSAISITEFLTLNSVLAYKTASDPNSLLRGNMPITLIQKNASCQIRIPSQYLFDLSQIVVYSEEVKKGALVIYQYNASYADGIPLKKIYKKVKCFESNPNLMYLFMNTLVEDELYLVKKGLDYSKISSGNFPNRNKFNLSTNDTKNIAKFCKKNVLSNPNEYRINLRKSKTKCKNLTLKLSAPNVYTNNQYTADATSKLFVVGENNVNFYGNNLNKYGISYLLKSSPQQLIKVVFSEQNPIVLTFTDEPNSRNKLKLFSIETNDKVYFNDVNELLKTIPSDTQEGTKATLINIKFWWQKAKSSVIQDGIIDKGKSKLKDKFIKKDHPTKDKKSKKSSSKRTDKSTNMSDDHTSKPSLWQRVKSWFTRDKSSNKEKNKSKDKSSKKDRPSKDKRSKKSTSSETELIM